MVAGFDTDWGISQANYVFDTASSTWGVYPYYNDDDSDADWYLEGYLKTHHVILIPKTNLFKARMHDSATNSMGYLGSEMNYTTLPGLNNKLLNILGSHMKFHSITSTYCYTVASDTADTDTWGVYTSLLTEEQVFGCTRYSIPESDYYPDNNKLPVFNFINAWENENDIFWLRGVSRGRSDYFVDASSLGRVGNYYASYSLYGVRPRLMLI